MLLVRQTRDAVRGMLFALLFLPALATARVVGPDAQGYTGTDELPYSWDEIAPGLGGPGTELTSLTGRDDDIAGIPIGFPFRFYGENQTGLFVSVNGLLAFEEDELTNAFTNLRIPNAAAPNRIIAVFWDDLNLGPTQAVYYSVLGAEPYRRLVIEYFGPAHFNDPNARYFFQVTLYETWNRIHCQYRDMHNGPSFFYGDGRSATIGIEDGSGANGMEWSYNRIRALTNGASILFSPTSQADVQLTKTVAPGPYYLQGDLVYTLTVSNAGPDRATEVELIDALPSSLLLTGVTNSQGVSSSGGNVITSRVGTVESGSSAVVRVHARAQAAGVLTNAATAAAVQPDPNPANNTATQTVTILEGVPLTVSGLPEPYGVSTPYGYGTTSVLLGAVLTNRVDSPANEGGGTQYVCIGWAGSATVPSHGYNPAVFTVTGATTFTWYWSPNYYLSLGTTGSGFIGGAAEGWKDPTYIFDLVPHAASGYYFSHWITNGSPAGSSVPLTIEMLRGPQDVVAVFTSAFKDVTGNTSSDFISWTLNRQSGTFFGTLRVCNDAGSGMALKGPFWYEVPPTADYRLMFPTGTNALDGIPYVNITPQVRARLFQTGNFDNVMDPGECVIVTNIEFYFRTRVPVVGFLHALWADPPDNFNFDEATADTDRDGIPNAWEDRFGLNRNNPADARLDADNDRLLNREEYLSDTDPADPASFLRVQELRREGDKFVVRWFSGTNANLLLQWSGSSPDDAGWISVRTNRAGTNPKHELDVQPDDSPGGFFRLSSP